MHLEAATSTAGGTGKDPLGWSLHSSVLCVLPVSHFPRHIPSLGWLLLCPLHSVMDGEVAAGARATKIIPLASCRQSLHSFSLFLLLEAGLPTSSPTSHSVAGGDTWIRGPHRPRFLQEAPCSGEDCTASPYFPQHEHPGWRGMVPLGDPGKWNRFGTILGRGQSCGQGRRKGSWAGGAACCGTGCSFALQVEEGDVWDERKSLYTIIPPPCFLRLETDWLCTTCSSW